MNQGQFKQHLNVVINQLVTKLGVDGRLIVNVSRTDNLQVRIHIGAPLPQGLAQRLHSQPKPPENKDCHYVVLKAAPKGMGWSLQYLHGLDQPFPADSPSTTIENDGALSTARNQEFATVTADYIHNYLLNSIMPGAPVAEPEAVEAEVN